MDFHNDNSALYAIELSDFYYKLVWRIDVALRTKSKWNNNIFLIRFEEKDTRQVLE